MHGERIVAPETLEGSQRGTTAHVVLGVNLQPLDGRTSVVDLGEMRRAQPDTGAGERLGGHGTRWTRPVAPGVRAPVRTAAGRARVLGAERPDRDAAMGPVATGNQTRAPDKETAP